MTAAKKPVVNQDLWQELDEQAARHKTTWVWTKGHASHADNNRCDELARARRKSSRAGRNQAMKRSGFADLPLHGRRRPARDLSASPEYIALWDLPPRPSIR